MLVEYTNELKINLEGIMKQLDPTNYYKMPRRTALKLIGCSAATLAISPHHAYSFDPVGFAREVASWKISKVIGGFAKQMGFVIGNKLVELCDVECPECNEYLRTFKEHFWNVQCPTCSHKSQITNEFINTVADKYPMIFGKLIKNVLAAYEIGDVNTFHGVKRAFEHDLLFATDTMERSLNDIRRFTLQPMLKTGDINVQQLVAIEYLLERIDTEAIAAMFSLKRLVCRANIELPSKFETIFHEWYRNGKLIGGVDRRPGSDKNWVTASHYDDPVPGAYDVLVKTEKGEVLSSKHIEFV